MPKGQDMVKFERYDKRRIRGKVKHTRTGACTCKLGATCYHGRTENLKTKVK
jgi:hypothetical protein